MNQLKATAAGSQIQTVRYVDCSYFLYEKSQISEYMITDHHAGLLYVRLAREVSYQNPPLPPVRYGDWHDIKVTAAFGTAFVGTKVGAACFGAL